MTEADRIHTRDIAAAFDWWRMAGVDCDYTDDATDWLATPVIAKAAQSPAAKQPAPPDTEILPAATRTDLLGSNPPEDLMAFREWWMTEPALDAIGPRGRVPPRGEAGAQLMVLVMDPEQGDERTLLSQSQGRLLSNMLASMGVAESGVYVASVLPRHTPMADAGTIANQGYRDVLRLHFGLAAPRSIIAFGISILPLLTHNAAQETASPLFIQQNSFRAPLLVSEGLDSLLAMPQLKARFWRRWLEWSGKQA